MPDRLSRRTFEMSSLLPDMMRKVMLECEIDVGEKSRGFTLNDDGLMDLIRCLNMGSKEYGCVKMKFLPRLTLSSL